MEVNKLPLKAFYESHKDAYINARQSHDTTVWDEQYKWDILPKLNAQLSKIESISDENAREVVSLLKKNNPSSGSFCHWIDLDNLGKQLEQKPVTSKALTYIWRPSPAVVGDEINSVNNLLHTFFSGEFKLSPSAYGYTLAAQDCENFAIYRESLLDELVEINGSSKPQNQGEKYQLLNDCARYIGSCMAEEKDKYADLPWYTALNGQDFLYVILQYPSIKA